jgi:transposase
MPAAENTELSSTSLDHLGIVAGIIDEIGLVEEVDKALGRHAQEAVSSGVAVKAMILNGLGFVSAPLYLFERFFIGKAAEHLLGKGVKPEHLSDDKLGKVLDKLFEAGVSELFVKLALRACKHYGVNLSRLHLDASSFSVHGAYEASPNEEAEEGVIRITYGYSRERRPDLKQFLVDLLASPDEGVPVLFDSASGNSSDKERFAELMSRYRKLLDLDALFVADSALYSQENLQALSGLRFLTRVPVTLKEAKALLDELEATDFSPSSLVGYRIGERTSDYGGVEQRWLIIESDAARARSLERQHKELKRLEQALGKELRALKRRSFHCEADARAAVAAFETKLKLHRLDKVSVRAEKRYLQPGRPTAETPFELSYRVHAELTALPEAITGERQRSSRFILASNDFTLSVDELLGAYKEQQVVERGFRFLRDPLFLTSSVFLKSEQRIMALAMIMALCLLVYSLGQRLIRRNLAREQASVPDQKGKPTGRPTLRWVFQLFMSVHLVTLANQQVITNLTEERKHLLRFFSPTCRKYYLLQ